MESVRVRRVSLNTRGARRVLVAQSIKASAPQARAAALDAYLAARDAEPAGSPAVLAQLEADVLAANEGLVRFVAGKYRFRWKDADLFDDLVQEGQIGLLTSLRLYRDDGRATLATFAFFRIRERIARWAYEESSPLRVSVSTQRDARRREQAGERATSRLPRVVPLSVRCDDDDNLAMDLPWDDPGPEALLVSREVRMTLAAAVAALPARQRGLLIRNLGLDGSQRTSQADLATELGVSRQRVHQIVEGAVRRLRGTPEIAALR